MLYDYKCINKECIKCKSSEVQERNCKMQEMNLQTCDSCGELLQRVFLFAPSIKPANDCYKG